MEKDNNKFNTITMKPSRDLKMDDIIDGYNAWLAKYMRVEKKISEEIHNKIKEYLRNNKNKFFDLYYDDEGLAKERLRDRIYDIINDLYGFTYAYDIYYLNEENIFEYMLRDKYDVEFDKPLVHLTYTDDGERKYHLLVIRKMYETKPTPYEFDQMMFTNLISLTSIDRYGNTLVSVNNFISCLYIIDMFDLSSEKRFVKEGRLNALLDKRVSDSKKSEHYHILLDSFARLLSKKLNNPRVYTNMRYKLLPKEDGNVQPCVIFDINGENN